MAYTLRPVLSEKALGLPDWADPIFGSLLACIVIFIAWWFVGNPMLAHKASAEAHIAAEVIAGKKHYFDAKCIPSVAYTDPEIAHVGMYEQDAHEKGIPVETLKTAFSDIDRAITDGEDDGFIKVHLEKGTDKILGATIVARHAGEMISDTPERPITYGSV